MVKKLKKLVGRSYAIYLLATGTTSVLSLLILCGGDPILSAMGLQWRNWVIMTLSALGGGGAWLFAAGLTVFLLRRVKGTWKVRVPAVAAAAVLVVAIGWMTLYVPFLLLFGNTPEEVVIWNGQKCVTSDVIWFDVRRDWYEYHGPFVMGKESLRSELNPLDEAGY